MLKFPERSFKVDITPLGVIELKELSVAYRHKCNEDPQYDTAENVLIDAGMSVDQVGKLGVSQVSELALEVVEFTYPGTKEKIANLDKEVSGNKTDLKKN